MKGEHRKYGCFNLQDADASWDAEGAKTRITLS